MKLRQYFFCLVEVCTSLNKRGCVSWSRPVLMLGCTPPPPPPPVRKTLALGGSQSSQQSATVLVTVIHAAMLSHVLLCRCQIAQRVLLTRWRSRAALLHRRSPDSLLTSTPPPTWPLTAAVLWVSSTPWYVACLVLLHLPCKRRLSQLSCCSCCTAQSHNRDTHL